MTLAFFALFGFIFLITQYFQFLRDYGALETGVRLLPVALSTGTAAVLGTMLAVRIGNKAVVATGPAPCRGDVRLDLERRHRDQLPRDRRRRWSCSAPAWD